MLTSNISKKKFGFRALKQFGTACRVPNCFLQKSFHPTAECRQRCTLYIYVRTITLSHFEQSKTIKISGILNSARKKQCKERWAGRIILQPWFDRWTVGRAGRTANIKINNTNRAIASYRDPTRKRKR